MSQHDRLQEILARRAELSPADEDRLRAHLASCPDCRERAAAYQRQRELLRSLPVAQPPPALRANVVQRIRQPQPAHQTRRRWPVLLAPLAAALVVAIVVGTHLGHPTIRTAGPALPSSTPAPTTQVQPSASPHTIGPVHHPSAPPTVIRRTRQTPVRQTQPPAAHATAAPPTSAPPTNPQPGPIVSQRLPVATPTSLPVIVPPAPATSPTPALIAAAPASATHVAAGIRRPVSTTSPVRPPMSASHPAPPSPSPAPASPTPVSPTPIPPTGTPVPAPTLAVPAASPTVVVATPLPAPNRAVPAEAPPVLPAVPRRPFPPLPIYLPPTLVPFPVPTPTP